MAKAPLFSVAAMEPVAKQAMYADINAWAKAVEELEPLLAKEKELRVNVFNKYFAPAGVEEGVNHIALSSGYLLSADYRINRKVDEAQLDAALVTGRIDRTAVDELFNYKPSLRVGVWKDATPETRVVFADIITEEPGTPGLKLKAPKR